MKVYLPENRVDNELKRFMEDAYVTSPYTDEIFEMISELHSSVEEKIRAGLLYGPTDFGKSAAIERYKKDYIKAFIKAYPYKDNRPFIEATMSAASTRHELMTSLLTSAGDISPSKGTLLMKEDRLKELVIVQESSLVIIDDFGRLLRDSGTSFNKTMCNYIQHLMDEVLRIPFLLSGVDECRFILDKMKELERRTPYKLRLKPYQMNNDKNSRRFTRFLQAIEQGVPRKTIELSNLKMAKRLIIASNGVPGTIKTLIEQAYKRSLNDSDSIKLEHYEKAYDRIYEASEESENRNNQLRTSAKVKRGTNRKPLQETYSYRAPFNPFRQSISINRLDNCIRALYE